MNIKKISFVALFVIVLFALISCVEKPTEEEKEPPGFRVDPQIYPCPYVEPSVSLDGSKILFFRAKVTRINKNGYNTEFNPDSTGFWVCNVDGSDMKLIYHNSNYFISNPQFTPNMEYIVFVKNYQICKAKYNGITIEEDDIEQLTFDGRNYFPTISNDGEWIAFDSNDESPNGMSFIWKMRIDGANKNRITYAPNVGEIRMPNWSKIENRIVHIRYINKTGEPDICIMDSSGADFVRLTNNPGNFKIFPRLSPDNKRVAFTTQNNSEFQQIIILDLENNLFKQLTIDGVYSNCSWTPDDRIVYINYAPFNYDIKNGTIWIMDSDGGNKKQLTFNHKLILE